MIKVNATHVKALIHKEFKQILSDKSVFVVVFLIPFLLILLYGSGMRMDVKPVPVAIVSSKIDDVVVKELSLSMAGSSYFDMHVLTNELDAKRMLQRHDIAAYVLFPDNLAQKALHQGAKAIIVINGADSQQATAARSYLEALILNSMSLKGLSRQVTYLSSANTQAVMQSGSAAATSIKDITIVNRNWFNESNTSTWYLLGGQIVGVVTLMAAFMSSIVIAREFERGTMTGLLATNATALEVLLSKIVPYYTLSIIGGTVAILIALMLYELPFRGSVFFFVATFAVYLYVAMMLGLLISTLTRNQFLSAEYAIIMSFLPSILLSGAVFDLRAIAPAISFVAHLFPPTYAVQSSKICLLSGGSIDILIRNLGILLVFAALLSLACYKALSIHFKRFDITADSKISTKAKQDKNGSYKADSLGQATKSSSSNLNDEPIVDTFTKGVDHE